MSASAAATVDAFARLRARVQAFRDAWRDRDKTTTASVAALLSVRHLGEPLSERLHVRLLEGRRELDLALARFAGDLASSIARLARDGDTAAMEQRLFDDFNRLARTDEQFEARLAELSPLVDLYVRLATALGVP